MAADFYRRVRRAQRRARAHARAFRMKGTVRAAFVAQRAQEARESVGRALAGERP